MGRRRSQHLQNGLWLEGENVLEHGVSIALRWVVDVRVVEEVLDTEEDLEGPKSGFSLSHSMSHFLQFI